MIFASGFSDKLRREASKHRPPSADLTREQILILSGPAGYPLKTRGFSQDGFTLYHPDGVHGIDDGLYLIWHVRPGTDNWTLVFYPTIRFHYIRGGNDKIIEEMHLRLASFVHFLGYRQSITVSLDEEIVVLPDLLLHPESPWTVVYLSEFQETYRPLYQFLKEKMNPVR